MDTVKLSRRLISRLITKRLTVPTSAAAAAGGREGGLDAEIYYNYVYKARPREKNMRATVSKCSTAH